MKFLPFCTIPGNLSNKKWFGKTTLRWDGLPCQKKVINVDFCWFF